MPQVYFTYKFLKPFGEKSMRSAKQFRATLLARVCRCQENYKLLRGQGINVLLFRPQVHHRVDSSLLFP